MTAIIVWADGVVSLAEPPTVSECSVRESAVVSGLLFPDSPSHDTDGLNNLSRKMLGGGTASRFAPMRANTSAAWLFSRAMW